MTNVSPKRHRTNMIVTIDEKVPYMGTPDKEEPVDTTAVGSKTGTPDRIQPTPIRMGIVRKSLANFARAAIPQKIGKAVPPSLPAVDLQGKARGPALPPVPKKASSPPSESVFGALPQLRPLFWNTFPPPSDRACVWDDVDVSVTGISDLVFQAEPRLVSLFLHNLKKVVKQAAPPSKQPAVKALELVMHGKRLMKVLDDRKTQNLSIAFRKFPEPEEVMEAIVNVDTDKLSGEQVALLLAEFPSPELCTEIELVEASHPEEEDHMFEWDRPEQYLLVLACIHNCKNLLTVWSFAVNQHVEGGTSDRVSSSSQFGGIKGQLTDFITACDAVCQSTSLRVFLAAIRQVGNRVNLNTPRGNARGVAVESILQFDDLRSAGAGSASLLAVVVEVWLAKNPDNLNELKAQLTKVLRLRIPSIQELEVDLNKQAELAKRSARSLQNYYQTLEDESSVVIADKLKQLAEPVERQIKANSDLLARAKMTWNKCVEYFCLKGESNLASNSNEFFDHWKRIVKVLESKCN